MKRIVFSVFVSVLFVIILSGCGRDRIANFERIDTSPLNYLATHDVKTDFYHKLGLSFEQQRKLMERKSIVVQKTNRNAVESLVKIRKEYILICIDKECKIFSDDILSEDFVRNIINNPNC